MGWKTIASTQAKSSRLTFSLPLLGNQPKHISIGIQREVGLLISCFFSAHHQQQIDNCPFCLTVPWRHYQERVLSKCTITQSSRVHLVNPQGSILRVCKCCVLHRCGATEARCSSAGPARCSYAGPVGQAGLCRLRRGVAKPAAPAIGNLWPRYPQKIQTRFQLSLLLELRNQKRSSRYTFTSQHELWYCS